MSDPTGVLVSTASADGSNRGSTEDAAVLDADTGLAAAAPTPSPADGAAVEAAPPASGDQAGPEGVDRSVAAKVEIDAAASAPQSAFTRLLSGIVQLPGAASR